MGTILFMISVVASIVLYPLGFIYSLLRLATSMRFSMWSKRFDQILKSTAVSVDKTGNVFMQELFNDVMIKKIGYRFGQDDETISSVLGKNKVAGTLTKFGRAMSCFLDRIDPNHVENSIKPK